MKRIFAEPLVIKLAFGSFCALFMPYFRNAASSFLCLKSSNRWNTHYVASTKNALWHRSFVELTGRGAGSAGAKGDGSGFRAAGRGELKVPAAILLLQHHSDNESCLHARRGSLCLLLSTLLFRESFQSEYLPWFLILNSLNLFKWEVGCQGNTLDVWTRAYKRQLFNTNSCSRYSKFSSMVKGKVPVDIMDRL